MRYGYSYFDYAMPSNATHYFISSDCQGSRIPRPLIHHRTYSFAKIKLCVADDLDVADWHGTVNHTQPLSWLIDRVVYPNFSSLGPVTPSTSLFEQLRLQSQAGSDAPLLAIAPP